jgi:hypothetical protein
LQLWHGMFTLHNSMFDVKENKRIEFDGWFPYANHNQDTRFCMMS